MDNPGVITVDEMERAIGEVCDRMGLTWGITTASGIDTYSVFNELHRVLFAVQMYSNQLIFSSRPYVEELEFMRLLCQHLRDNR